MKIEYNKLIFNLGNVRIILIFLLFYIASENLINYSLEMIQKRFELAFDKKYSFDVALNYHRGGVVNAQAFIDNSLIYNKLGKHQRELSELKYAKFLLINNANNLYNKQLLSYVNTRMKEIDHLNNSNFEKDMK
jgi:hypothetical protein